MQTVRIITRVLSAATSAGEAAATAALLERLCLGAGISFLNLGTTSSEALLREGLLQKISEVTSHTSCSFRWVLTCRGCCAVPVHLAFLISAKLCIHVLARSWSAVVATIGFCADNARGD